MNDFRIIRQVDKLGRIVIPKDVRTHLGIEAGAFVELIVCDEGVLLRTIKDEKMK